jgi:hypothetical protein
MPFLLNLETREIVEVFRVEPFIWVSIIVGGTRCLWNRKENQLITQTLDEARFVEEQSRGELDYTWGAPCPIVFPGLQRQNALSVKQWCSLM